MHGIYFFVQSNKLQDPPDQYNFHWTCIKSLNLNIFSCLGCQILSTFHALADGVISFTLLGRYFPFFLKTILGPQFFHCLIGIKRLYEKNPPKTSKDIWATYIARIYIKIPARWYPQMFWELSLTLHLSKETCVWGGRAKTGWKKTFLALTSLH